MAILRGVETIRTAGFSIYATCPSQISTEVLPALNYVGRDFSRVRIGQTWQEVAA